MTAHVFPSEDQCAAIEGVMEWAGERNHPGALRVWSENERDREADPARGGSWM